ncbi:MAG: cytochrome c4 [Sedimenticola sp.]|nr:cytochrome c4 [Sedimenticola sp.]MCW8881831.1 cytochrome c4 [Sedimenticola sp.]MCW8946016.1 cytochrome c4 [Sedimenticola sp.]MCW8975859.1 cytochrome c4 [Sedimenticola sp.]MCW9021870.1 cytochrome c4 [Sedimenticola sp.]
MAYKTLTKAALFAGLTVGAVFSAFAADDKPKMMMGADASMLANTCAGCHGTGGNSMGPAAPSIAGLSPTYFNETMAGFASGEIPSTIMGRIAKGYTEDEIKAISNFYSGKKFMKAKQDFDPALADKGAKLHDKYCEKCHADGGQSAEDDAGVLAGQWTPYVNWTLADYKAGDREATKKMKKKLEQMLEKEGSAGVSALLNFYASQQK